MAHQKTKKRRSSLDSLIRVMTLVLMVVLVAFFLRTQSSLESMEEKLGTVTAQVEHQRLKNKDLELSLADNETFLERTAREKLDFAHPEERVFVDASGIK